MSQTLKQLSNSQRYVDQPAVLIGDASGTELLHQLDNWVSRGWLRALDRSFATFILEQDPQAKASVLLAAAMTSHQLGRGHSCLDLAATLHAPDFVLSLPPEGEEGSQLPSQWLLGLDITQWRQALTLSPLVEDRDGLQRFPERPLVLTGQRLYLRRYWNYERSIAQALSTRLSVDAVTPEKLSSRLDALFPDTFEVNGERRSDWQKIACALAARGNFSVITGGPGTGKTTSVVRLLGLLQTPAVEDGKPLRIRLAAPTGKAAARLSESIGKAVRELPVSAPVCEAIPTDVSTLHRLLGSRPDSRNFIHHRDKPLELDVLVVDEASMIDLEMMACLLDALPRQARLILLGDKDQLASVDAGSVLGDLCRDAEAGGYSEQTMAWLKTHSGEAVSAPGFQTAVGLGDPLAQQTVMLRYSRRFDAEQGIGRLAKLVNEKTAVEARGLLDQQLAQLFNLKLRGEHDATLTDLIINGKGDAPGYRHYLEQLRDQRPGSDTAWDDGRWAAWAGKVLTAFDEFRLLCALRRGPWGVEGLNQLVAAELRRCELLSGDQGWYEGRPVLVTRNDYSLNLMNGDIGIAVWVPGPSAERVLRVAFPRNDGSGGVRFVMPSRLVEVETVFAMTVHKSQGSEFNHTTLVLPDALNPVLTKELLYTAITRAKQWFSLVEASPGVFEGAVSRNVQRTSGLALQLQDELAKLQRT
ncbi:exodeoxyribonuclease V subunit alpha [Pseudomonas fluorescens]|uniref:exodeoxyribonuclease V subunit alpha n=1 Tax=Pseudomonas sp. NBRC 111138 TaxID=1661053 RepID=UPI0006D42BDB|nr:exodeoxyribonuclease V subunit alpha [Pseudomonas sp. NBRC 111138]QQU68192.1 exodeoxyribonuclease V subunit alpha [Pseudomonas fluorescens]